MKEYDELFMKKAIELSAEAVRHGNEPFGEVLVILKEYFENHTKG